MPDRLEHLDPLVRLDCRDQLDRAVLKEYLERVVHPDSPDPPDRTDRLDLLELRGRPELKVYPGWVEIRVPPGNQDLWDRQDQPDRLELQAFREIWDLLDCPEILELRVAAGLLVHQGQMDLRDCRDLQDLLVPLEQRATLDRQALPVLTDN